ncbi:MAG: ATP-dependent helicase, partial [Acutalibacteraceae bacterium]
MFNSEFTQLRKKIIEMQFSRMNSMQKKAIFTVNGPLLVLAGAGSGKTTVLVNRIANLIKFGDAYNSDETEFEPTQRDIDIMKAYVEGKCDDLFEVEDLLSVRPAQPWQILAITFTNKAARELKERLEKMLGEKAGEIWASTFHSSCARILRKFGDRIGYTSHFTIYDTDDSRKMMKECQKQLGIEDKYLPHKTILHEISMAKDSLITPSEFRKSCGADTRMLKIASAYELYQKMLKKADAMDFDDIIVNTVELLETCPDVLEYYQNKFRYIMVDEYQDTNHAQYRLVSLLASKNENICVVGDDDQSIYKFRGATIENILSFEGEYRNCVTIRLEQNYRSTQTILDAANAVIRHNEKRKGKELWTGNGEGEKITVLTAYDENDEARLIVDEIIEQSSVHGRKFSDIAILYRMNAQSNSIEHVLTRNSIPYRIIGGLRFYDRLEIKDALAYLAVINNPSDEVRLRRIINVPKRGIGETTVSNASEIAAGLGISLFEVLEHADEYSATHRSANRLKEFTSMINDLRQMQETMPVDELFKKMLEVTGYTASLMLDADKGEERLENISELTNNLVTFV